MEFSIYEFTFSERLAISTRSRTGVLMAMASELVYWNKEKRRFQLTFGVTVADVVAFFNATDTLHNA
jgi:hypothetical protein